jgi:hypothetical protein
MRAFVKGTDIEIVGTLELCYGCGQIALDSFHAEPGGPIEFDWGGGTTMFWDDQETVQRDGKRVFLDEDANQYTEDQLELREDTDEE